MTRRIVLVALFAFALVPGCKTKKADNKAVAKVTPELEGENVLKEVLELNSAKHPAPPTQFRKGHVEARMLPKEALQNTEKGFQVQLPSGAPVATPVFYEGKIFTSGGFHSKEFYAFDAKSGKLEWAVTLDDDGPSTAACADGVCAFNTESCTLFVVNADTGRQLWSLWLGDPLTSAPTIANGLVYASYPASGHKRPPGVSHVLGAFELKTGKIVWQKWIDSDVMTAPVADGDKVYATTFGGTVYKFNGKDGEILSARRTRATSAPTIVAGELFYSQRSEGKGEAVSEGVAKVNKSGQTDWIENRKRAVYLDSKVQAQAKLQSKSEQLDAMNGFSGDAPEAANAHAAMYNVGYGRVSSMQAFQGSRVLNWGDNNFNCMGDELVATSAKNGEKLWSIKLKGDMADAGGFLAAPPVRAGKYIVVATLEGEVMIVSAKTGKKLQSYRVGSPVRYQPIVQDGWIYVGTQDGKLVAIDTKNTELTGWTHWGGDAKRNGI